MEDIVEKFRNSLADIMESRGVSIIALSNELKMDPSIVRRWLNKVRDIKLKTLVILADYFECSIEFLCGKTVERLTYNPKSRIPFKESLSAVMRELNIRPYQLFVNTNIIPSKYYYWMNGGEPLLTNLNTVAEYMGITLDRLVGLDR